MILQHSSSYLLYIQRYIFRYTKQWSVTTKTNYSNFRHYCTS